ncbi:MAG: alginate lyase family protein, partial [Phycisphaerae bacterium]|nr:alginate lyase family protein [Phycisphaerae bacterium]
PRAKAEYVKHIKGREKPRWYFDWRDRPESPDADDFDTTDADRYARNELVSVRVWHDFGGNIDWSINATPDGYHEWTWQLSRHLFWKALGEAFWKTGDEKYARAFVFQLNSWVEQNLVSADEVCNGVGSRWRTLEAGLRASLTWFPVLYYFLSSPSFDDESITTMVKSLVEHARYLMRWPSGGNWLATEANGLFNIGVMMPEFAEADEWRRTATERLYTELNNQVYPDGAQFELTSGYHQVTLGHLAMPVGLAKLNGVELPPDYLARLEKMYNYDVYASMPDRRLPALNDSRWMDIRRSCSQGFGLFPNRRDMQWMATDGAEGARPQHNSHAFPWAGHFVMRSGWDEADRYMLFGAGPFGHSHQHEDKLHFVLYAYGRVHVTDPGNYAYDSSEWRKYHVSAYAHNTILVDGLPQNRRRFARSLYETDEPLNGNWHCCEQYDLAVGTYNENPDAEEGRVEAYGSDGARPVTHVRKILFVKPNYWIVLDTLTPHDDAAHTYESPFHLEADAAAADEDSLIVTTQNPGGSNITIIPASAPGLELDIISGQTEPYLQGWVGDRIHGPRPIPTPTYKLTATGVAHLAYVFYPTAEGEACPVKSVALTDTEADGNPAVEVSFADGRKHTWHTGRKENALA